LPKASCGIDCIAASLEWISSMYCMVVFLSDRGRHYARPDG
jgi:hypothetical protein